MNLGMFDPNKKYPVKVLIREQRGGNVRWFFDRGGRFKNELGVDVIKLKKKKEDMAAPANWSYDMESGGGSILEVFSPKSGVYIPVRHVPSGGVEKLYASDSAVDEWAALKRKELARLTKPSEPWWQKWIPLFGMMGIAAMLMISVIFVFNAIPGMLGQEGANIDKVLQAAKIQAGITTSDVTSPTPAIGG